MSCDGGAHGPCRAGPLRPVRQVVAALVAGLDTRVPFARFVTVSTKSTWKCPKNAVRVIDLAENTESLRSCLPHSSKFWRSVPDSRLCS